MKLAILVLVGAALSQATTAETICGRVVKFETLKNSTLKLVTFDSGKFVKMVSDDFSNGKCESALTGELTLCVEKTAQNEIYQYSSLWK